MRLVCFSDTHGYKVPVPDGDVLIFAGDCSMSGRLSEILKFRDWIITLPHAHKIIIAGNHDFELEKEYGDEPLVDAGFCYLDNGSEIINGVKFYGSPYTPRFGNWAFMVDRGPKIAAHWEKIPLDTDVIITHGPPVDILDACGSAFGMASVGCFDLSKRIAQVKPKIHIFGHIHESYGHSHKDGTDYYNVSICNEDYDPVNKPVVIEL